MEPIYLPGLGTMVDDRGKYQLIPSVPAADGSMPVTVQLPTQAPEEHDLLPQYAQWGRRIAEEFLKSNLFQGITISSIVMNSVVIGLETDMPDMKIWDHMENVFLGVFALELVLRMFVMGVRPFFSCHQQDVLWNFFDFMIVVVGILNSLVRFLPQRWKNGFAEHDATIFGVLRLLRILRILRIIRVLRFLKQLYLLAYGFIEGALAVFWVSLLASVVIYVCAIVLVRTYRTEWDGQFGSFFQHHFGTVPGTMLTLFEIMAAPNLMGFREVMFEYPVLLGFLITFIIFGSFGMNGLLTGVISESIMEKNQIRIEADRIDREVKRKDMMKQCSDLFDVMDRHETGSLTLDEILTFKNVIVALLQKNNVVCASHDLDAMFGVMDYDDSGTIEKSEFVHGVLELCDEVRPMSIMELHYQVLRCYAKVQACDNKLTDVYDRVETASAHAHAHAERSQDLVRQMNSAVSHHELRTRRGHDGVRADDTHAVMDEMRGIVQELVDHSQTEAEDADAIVDSVQHATCGFRGMKHHDMGYVNHGMTHHEMAHGSLSCSPHHGMDHHGTSPHFFRAEGRNRNAATRRGPMRKKPLATSTVETLNHCPPRLDCLSAQNDPQQKARWEEALSPRRSQQFDSLRGQFISTAKPHDAAISVGALLSARGQQLVAEAQEKTAALAQDAQAQRIGQVSSAEADSLKHTLTSMMRSGLEILDALTTSDDQSMQPGATAGVTPAIIPVGKSLRQPTEQPSYIDLQ